MFKQTKGRQDCPPSGPSRGSMFTFHQNLNPPGILAHDLPIPFPASFFSRVKICDAAFRDTAGPPSINNYDTWELECPASVPFFIQLCFKAYMFWIPQSLWKVHGGHFLAVTWWIRNGFPFARIAILIVGQWKHLPSPLLATWLLGPCNSEVCDLR